MSPNEVRADYNLGGDKDGKKLLVSRDLTTLEYLIENPAKTPGQQGGKNE
jgi:hypothetical protein